MNQDQVGRWIQFLIDKDLLHIFYTHSEWLKLREDVLRDHNNECQTCKARGFYSRATHVHHVQWVRRHPRLALSKTYMFQGKEYKNLVPLCHACHEEEHPDRYGKRQPPLTEERW